MSGWGERLRARAHRSGSRLRGAVRPAHREACPRGSCSLGDRPPGHHIGGSQALHPVGLILSGGPASVYAEDAHRMDPAILAMGVPILGICYGHQLIAETLGGVVAHTGEGEYGNTTFHTTAGSVLFGDLPQEQQVWMSHGDEVVEVPEGFSSSARQLVLPSPPWRIPSGGSMGSSSIRRWPTHRGAARSSDDFSTTSAVPVQPGHRTRSSSPRSPRSGPGWVAER